jgi:hypothetical protein
LIKPEDTTTGLVRRNPTAKKTRAPQMIVDEPPPGPGSALYWAPATYGEGGPTVLGILGPDEKPLAALFRQRDGERGQQDVAGLPRWTGEPQRHEPTRHEKEWKSRGTLQRQQAYERVPQRLVVTGPIAPLHGASLEAVVWIAQHTDQVGATLDVADIAHITVESVREAVHACTGIACFVGLAALRHRLGLP